MPDDQNPTPEENSIPPSPQEPTEPTPINTAHSEPSEVLPGAVEAPGDGFSAESNNIPPSNSTLLEGSSEEITQVKPVPNEPNPEPISEPAQAPELETAQMGRNEPLSEASPTQTFHNPVREVLAKAKLAIQNKKRKKLDLILTLFAKRTNITNDEVEKFLHVSDATATRYLSILEKEGKIKQTGKTGRSVSYSKI